MVVDNDVKYPPLWIVKQIKQWYGITSHWEWKSSDAKPTISQSQKTNNIYSQKWEYSYISLLHSNIILIYTSMSNAVDYKTIETLYITYSVSIVNIFCGYNTLILTLVFVAAKIVGAAVAGLGAGFIVGNMYDSDWHGSRFGPNPNWKDRHQIHSATHTNNVLAVVLRWLHEK